MAARVVVADRLYVCTEQLESFNLEKYCFMFSSRYIALSCRTFLIN